MTDLDTIVQRLAVVAALEGRLAEVKKAAKAELAANLPRGTVYAFDGLGTDDEHQLGYASVPKPAQPKPVITIDDESEVFGWMVDEFGDDVIETSVQLTAQGRKSFEEFVLSAHRLTGETPPGVTVTVADPKPSTPRFVASKNVDALVERMVREGRLNIGDMLALDPAN